MSRISIIVPVYNAERYLDKCIESILGQTYTDLELILINDGSRDNSCVICDRWSEKDSRVRVIHQNNKGASATRNVGLDVASGEYICFVDADDWLEKDMVEQVCKVMDENAVDMVLFDPYVHIAKTGETYIDSIHLIQESGRILKTEITPEQLRYIAGTIWRFVYKRSLLNEHAIRFDIQLPLSEDRIFNIVALGCSTAISYLQKPLYHYWINDGGATSKYRENMMDVVLATQEKAECVLSQYWDASYIPIYEQVNIVDGALLCVYNIFSPKNKSRFRSKYERVQEVVSHNRICAAYGKLKKLTIRQWLVKNKCCLLLCVVGMLWNLKNR